MAPLLLLPGASPAVATSSASVLTVLLSVLSTSYVVVVTLILLRLLLSLDRLSLLLVSTVRPRKSGWTVRWGLWYPVLPSLGRPWSVVMTTLGAAPVVSDCTLLRGVLKVSFDVFYSFGRGSPSRLLFFFLNGSPYPRTPLSLQCLPPLRGDGSSFLLSLDLDAFKDLLLSSALF